MLKNEVSFSICKYQPWYKNIKYHDEINFESCMSIRCLAPQHIRSFSIFVAGFAFAFGNFAHYCVVLLNAPLSDRDKKNKNV